MYNKLVHLHRQVVHGQFTLIWDISSKQRVISGRIVRLIFQFVRATVNTI